MRLGVDGVAERAEIGAAILSLHDKLTVEDGGSAAKPRRRLHDWRVLLRPIVAAAGEGASLTVLDDQQRSMTVMLDLVQPAWIR
jgi:hypothetical protein